MMHHPRGDVVDAFGKPDLPPAIDCQRARECPPGLRLQTRRCKCDSTRGIARSTYFPPPGALTKLRQTMLDQGLSCVFCIGEPLPIREKGVDAVLAECANQLEDIVGICVEIVATPARY